MTNLTDELARGGRGSSQVCPFCGQPVRDQKARRRIGEGRRVLARLLAAAPLEAHEAPPVEREDELPEYEADAKRDGERAIEAAKQAHDVRVTLRTF